MPECMIREIKNPTQDPEVLSANRARREGRYDDALVHFQRLVSRKTEFTTLNSLGNIHLLLGDVTNALKAYRESKTTYSGERCAMVDVGMVLWLLGCREDACQDWKNQIDLQRKGVITNTTDGAGGVILPSLLWWASTHEGMDHWRKPAEQELARKWKTKGCQMAPWPGLLAAYLRGIATEDEVLAPTKDPKYPDWEDEQRRRALFYIAARRRADGDLAGARAALVEVAGPVTERILSDVEFHLARHELGMPVRIGPEERLNPHASR